MSDEIDWRSYVVSVPPTYFIAVLGWLVGSWSIVAVQALSVALDGASDGPAWIASAGAIMLTLLAMWRLWIALGRIVVSATGIEQRHLVRRVRFSWYELVEIDQDWFGALILRDSRQRTIRVSEGVDGKEELHRELSERIGSAPIRN